MRIGHARATRYAVPREIRSFGDTWPVFRIDTEGHPQLAAQLHSLHPRGWWYESNLSVPAWLHGEFSLGLFADLPWFLDDLRPQGFMGRAFARLHADELGLSPDPRMWDAAGVLIALLLYGDDLPGDFVVGDVALERVQRTSLLEPASIRASERPARYSDLAAAVLAGEVPGSSAGGEQPKFTTCVYDGRGYRHVLVKFSLTRDSPVGARWADMLVCEHLAAEVLSENGISAAETALIESGNRLYLEVTRFDRVGAHGRRGMVSLMALDNATFGKLDNWYAAADRLEQERWLRREDADTLRVLWLFGGLIANTDLHFGNISLNLAHGRPLLLAPAYDMLPMHYRPTVTGELGTQDFVPRLPTPTQLPFWQRAAVAALAFWERVSSDARISPEFRAEAAEMQGKVRVLRQRFG